MMKVKDLNRTHPTYAAAELRRHADLFEGGAAFRARVSTYLIQAELEEGRTYALRCRHALYENHVAPIVDQWAAEVWADPPALVGAASEEDRAWARDVDRQGSDLGAFWLDTLTTALVHGCAWVLVDRPEVGAVPPRDRAEAKAQGVAESYLVPLHPLQVLDWDEDGQGSLTSILWRQASSRRPGPGEPRILTTTWTWWSRAGWQRWIHERPEDEPLDEEAEVQLAGEGQNPAGVVPVVRLRLPVAGWMLRLLEEPALGLFRAQSALDWSLYKSAFATLAIKRAWPDENPTVRLGPGGFVALEQGDDWGFLEPSGQSWTALEAAIKRRLEGLYRIAKQIALSVSNDSTRARSSGVAKDRDRRPMEIALGVVGGLVLEAIRATLALRAQAAGRPAVEVVGLSDYAEADPDAWLNQALAVQTLGVPSPTFQEAWLEQLVTNLLPGLAPETQQRIREELVAGVAARFAEAGVYGPEGSRL